MKKNIDPDIYFQLEKASRKVKQYTKQVFKEKGLDITVEQWAILKKVAESEGQSQKEIAASTYKDTPTLTRIIDLMTDKGLVERRIHKEDRRKFGIYLTDNGRKMVDKVIPLESLIRQKGLEGMDEKELKGLQTMLSNLFENFEEEEDN